MPKYGTPLIDANCIGFEQRVQVGDESPEMFDRVVNTVVAQAVELTGGYDDAYIEIGGRLVRLSVDRRKVDACAPDHIVTITDAGFIEGENWSTYARIMERYSRPRHKQFGPPCRPDEFERYNSIQVENRGGIMPVAATAKIHTQNNTRAIQPTYSVGDPYPSYGGQTFSLQAPLRAADLFRQTARVLEHATPQADYDYHMRRDRARLLPPERAGTKQEHRKLLK